MTVAPLGYGTGMSNMFRFRWVALIGAAVLALGGLASCDTESIDDVELPDVELDEPEAPDGDGSGGAAASGPDTDADPEPGAGADAAFDDDGALGTLGAAYLDSTVGRAVVEIDTSPGRMMGDPARGALVDRLAEHGGKEVEFAGSDTLPERETWSDAQLRQVAADHRSTSSTGGSIALHAMAVSGEHERGGVLGVALDASTFAVFPDAMGGGPLAGLDGDDVEIAVVVHELGHLFGLVNLTGEGGFHEDPDHPHHSQSEDSVMHWAIDTDAISQIFSGPPPTTFNNDDREEMERIRSSG